MVKKSKQENFITKIASKSNFEKSNKNHSKNNTIKNPKNSITKSQYRQIRKHRKENLRHFKKAIAEKAIQQNIFEEKKLQIDSRFSALKSQIFSFSSIKKQPSVVQNSYRKILDDFKNEPKIFAKRDAKQKEDKCNQNDIQNDVKSNLNDIIEFETNKPKNQILNGSNFSLNSDLENDKNSKNNKNKSEKIDKIDYKKIKKNFKQQKKEKERRKLKSVRKNTALQNAAKMAEQKKIEFERIEQQKVIRRTLEEENKVSAKDLLKSKRDVWTKLSAEMKKKGYSATAKDVATKLRTLRLSYRRTVDSIQRGERRGNHLWKYFNSLDEIIRQERAVLSKELSSIMACSLLDKTLLPGNSITTQSKECQPTANGTDSNIDDHSGYTDPSTPAIKTKRKLPHIMKEPPKKILPKSQEDSSTGESLHQDLIEEIKVYQNKYTRILSKYADAAAKLKEEQIKWQKKEEDYKKREEEYRKEIENLRECQLEEQREHQEEVMELLRKHQEEMKSLHTDSISRQKTQPDDDHMDI